MNSNEFAGGLALDPRSWRGTSSRDRGVEMNPSPLGWTGVEIDLAPPRGCDIHGLLETGVEIGLEGGVEMDRCRRWRGNESGPQAAGGSEGGVEADLLAHGGDRALTWRGNQFPPAWTTLI